MNASCISLASSHLQHLTRNISINASHSLHWHLTRCISLAASHSRHLTRCQCISDSESLGRARWLTVECRDQCHGVLKATVTDMPILQVVLNGIRVSLATAASVAIRVRLGGTRSISLAASLVPSEARAGPGISLAASHSRHPTRRISLTASHLRHLSCCISLVASHTRRLTRCKRLHLTRCISLATFHSPNLTLGICISLAASLPPHLIRHISLAASHSPHLSRAETRCISLAAS